MISLSFRIRLKNENEGKHKIHRNRILCFFIRLHI